MDNSISKTCNFPVGASRDDVAKAYMLAWDLGCKGLTVYVTGCLLYTSPPPTA